MQAGKRRRGAEQAAPVIELARLGDGGRGGVAIGAAFHRRGDAIAAAVSGLLASGDTPAAPGPSTARRAASTDGDLEGRQGAEGLRRRGATVAGAAAAGGHRGPAGALLDAARSRSVFEAQKARADTAAAQLLGAEQGDGGREGPVEEAAALVAEVAQKHVRLQAKYAGLTAPSPLKLREKENHAPRAALAPAPAPAASSGRRASSSSRGRGAAAAAATAAVARSAAAAEEEEESPG